MCQQRWGTFIYLSLDSAYPEDMIFKSRIYDRQLLLVFLVVPKSRSTLVPVDHGNTRPDQSLVSRQTHRRSLHVASPVRSEPRVKIVHGAQCAITNDTTHNNATILNLQIYFTEKLALIGICSISSPWWCPIFLSNHFQQSLPYCRLDDRAPRHGSDMVKKFLLLVFVHMDYDSFVLSRANHFGRVPSKPW